MKHAVISNQDIVNKVVARRGRLHAFEYINPKSTALVVVDMMVASLEAEPRCRNMIDGINQLASTLRSKGGTISWVTSSSAEVSENDKAVFGSETAHHFHERAQPDDPRSKLPPELKLTHRDIHALKEGFSAFFPGRSNLHEQLSNRDIDTLLICGTVTNICCESSARDAVELGYKVIMVADLNDGHGHGLHEATLTTFYRTFGDVRLSSEICDLIGSE